MELKTKLNKCTDLEIDSDDNKLDGEMNCLQFENDEVLQETMPKKTLLQA